MYFLKNKENTRCDQFWRNTHPPLDPLGTLGPSNQLKKASSGSKVAELFGKRSNGSESYKDPNLSSFGDLKRLLKRFSCEIMN